MSDEQIGATETTALAEEARPWQGTEMRWNSQQMNQNVTDDPARSSG